MVCMHARETITRALICVHIMYARARAGPGRLSADTRSRYHENCWQPKCVLPHERRRCARPIPRAAPRCLAMRTRVV